MSLVEPLPRRLPAPPPALDEATRARLQAQLPKEDGDLLRDYNAMARDMPVWLGLTVVGLVLGGDVLIGYLPEFGAILLHGAGWLLLGVGIYRKTLAIRSHAKGTPEHDRLCGHRLLLAGLLVAFLPAPVASPAFEVVMTVKWLLALTAFGLAFDRLALRPMRRSEAKPRS